mgnify:CR=1 FL=1
MRYNKKSIYLMLFLYFVEPNPNIARNIVGKNNNPIAVNVSASLDRGTL